MAEQMDGQLFACTTKLDKCKLSFYLPNDTFTNYINIEHKIKLRPLQLPQIQFIIGLNLLFVTFQGCLFTPTLLTFLTFPSLSFTSELAQKRGGSPLSSPCCATCLNCSRHQTVHPVEFLEEA